MRVTAVSLRDFRSYERVQAALGNGMTVIAGRNGAGKTNLIEAVYFGCTGRSCRTTNERELVRFGASSTRVVVSTRGEDGVHELAVGFAPGQPKRMKVDGATVDRLVDVAQRPLVSVFLPDRLELIKGPPTLRRGHLDQFISALWPARAATRRSYSQALAQRNALIGRIRSGGGSRASLTTWDRQLARYGVALMGDRAAAVEKIDVTFTVLGEALGLDGGPSVCYRPASQARSVEGFASELAARTDSDIDRGFTGHGPHRDEVVTLRAGRDLRIYGSQGQQRLALLALLLAERKALTESRCSTPLMLLDDVMSELDHSRREALVEVLRDGGGQSIITTTDVEHVPGASERDLARMTIADGHVLREVVA
jgi:DNA replication and repair protein RecF